MTDNPIAKLGELSKPATVLVERISDAVGGIFKPYQIVRVAKAEAEAERIRAESQIQVTDLHRRAMHRFLEEEAKRQSNMESITELALPLLRDQSQPQEVESDWITNFFDKGRIVSDQQMQELWARVLAGQANAPGSFSRRTVNLLADLDKVDAELFASVCRFIWWIADAPIPLIYKVGEGIYEQHDIYFSSLSHLESLGLIQFDAISGFNRTALPRKFRASYFGRQVQLTLRKDADNVFALGQVLLTRAGDELASVCSVEPVEGFFEFVCERWGKRASVVSDD